MSFTLICPAAHTGRYSIQDCVKYDRLMAYHVKRMIREGISGKGEIHQGYPKMERDEVVPTQKDVYKLNPMRNSKPRATKTHAMMPFLRQHPVIEAVERMKNKCVYPVKIKKNMNWNNFLQYFYEFHVHYCDLEGLTMSHALTRRVLLYLCYGTYTDKGKEFPIIRCLHYKTIQGRHRFGKYVGRHFAQFIEKVKAHPEWTVFFDDLGKGDAPMEYLVLVEMGLRSFGTDIHAMGSRAMDSKERWCEVAVWRKREAYIAAIRHIRGHNTYPQWDCYTLEDYSERQSLHKTFVKRHFPLSNGACNRLDEHLVDPKEWSDSGPELLPTKLVKQTSKVKPYVKAAVAEASAKPMIWDVENNCFVPF